MDRNSSQIEQGLLQVEGLSQSYGRQVIFSGVDLSLRAGEIVCLAGPSGCGKTSLLETIAGIQQPKAGRLLWAAPLEAGAIGYMAQYDCLLPWLNVRENIRFRSSLLGMEQDDARLESLLVWGELAGRAASYPDQLSGGQRQRVALLRELYGLSRSLFLDEPFSNLDTQLRLTLARRLRRHLQEHGQTALIVTHNQDDAALLADRVLFMDGSPARISHEVLCEPGQSREQFLSRISEAWLGASLLSLKEVA